MQKARPDLSGHKKSRLCTFSMPWSLHFDVPALIGTRGNRQLTGERPNASCMKNASGQGRTWKLLSISAICNPA